MISDAIVSGNRIYNNGVGGGGGSGINMDGVQDSRIENNLLYGNHASGISLYRIDGAAGSSGNVVVNNTIHQAADGRWALNIQNGSTGNAVLNNILVTEHDDRGAIDISADSLPGLVSDYNAVVSRFHIGEDNDVYSLVEWRANTGADVHSFVATPAELFVDSTGGDYRLRAGSPAIDQGTDDNAPAVDFVGNLRPPGALDIGALEHLASPSGDFTGDGRVDVSDLAAWRTAFGLNVAADADGDGDSDGADFLTWQRGLSPGPAGTAVPEPPSLSMIVLLTAVAVRGRSLAAKSRRRARASTPYTGFGLRSLKPCWCQ